jgi:hypothetical protein
VPLKGNGGGAAIEPRGWPLIADRSLSDSRVARDASPSVYSKPRLNRVDTRSVDAFAADDA